MSANHSPQPEFELEDGQDIATLLEPDDEEMEDMQSEGSMGDMESMENGHMGFTRTLFRAPRSESDTINSTRSLYDTDVDYISLHGRKYCGDYFMPIDEDEQTRLQMLHDVYLHRLENKLTTVTLNSPQKILDIGCGAGEWAMSMGEEYPDAEIIGQDIAQIQPSSAPSNVFFQIFDAEEEGGWTYAENDFDLIHIRGMEGAFTDWNQIYREAYKHLKPGGWIEVMDFDDHTELLGYFDENTRVSNWLSSIKESQAKSGRPLTITHLEPESLSSLGFVDVKSTIYDLPMGNWPEDIESQKTAKHFLVAQLCGVESYSLRPLTDLGWNVEDVRTTCNFITEKTKEVALHPERGLGIGCKFKILVGRKPGARDIGPVGRFLVPGAESEDDVGSVNTIRVVNGQVVNG